MRCVINVSCTDAAVLVRRFVRRLDRVSYEMWDQPPAISARLAGLIYHGCHADCSPSTTGYCVAQSVSFSGPPMIGGIGNVWRAVASSGMGHWGTCPLEFANARTFCRPNARWLSLLGDFVTTNFGTRAPRARAPPRGAKFWRNHWWRGSGQEVWGPSPPVGSKGKAPVGVRGEAPLKLNISLQNTKNK